MSIARSPSVPTITGSSQRPPGNSTVAVPSAFVPGQGGAAGEAAGVEEVRAVAVIRKVSGASRKVRESRSQTRGEV